MLFSVGCCLRIDGSGPAARFYRGRPISFSVLEVFLLSDFLLNCFDLLFDLLPQVDNLVIVLPFFAILISVMLSLTFKLIRGDYK